jgi:hypothetical protein
MARRPMAQFIRFRHSEHVMNQALSLPLALLDLSPITQLMGLFFLGWAFLMLVVIRIDGTRAR